MAMEQDDRISLRCVDIRDNSVIAQDLMVNIREHRRRHFHTLGMDAFLLRGFSCKMFPEGRKCPRMLIYYPMKT